VSPADLLDLFRSEMSDWAEPFLWSDEEVYGYIDDAQKMFCRLTDGISDATTEEVTQLQVDIGTTWLDTHPSILKIRDCYRTDTGRGVDVINREDMATRRMFFDGVPGVLRALVIGMEADKARVYPDSSEAVTLQLTVFRLPLADVTESSQTFEIAPEHHRHLLGWVKHLAYDKQDAETQDKKKSAEFEAAFRRYCTQSTDEERRKRHKPRAVAYGGL
jgi:hypothetical protein